MIPTVCRNVLLMPSARLAANVGHPGPWAAIVTAVPTVHPSTATTSMHIDLTVLPPNRDPFPLSNVAPFAGEYDGAPLARDTVPIIEASWLWPPHAA